MPAAAFVWVLVGREGVNEGFSSRLPCKNRPCRSEIASQPPAPTDGVSGRLGSAQGRYLQGEELLLLGKLGGHCLDLVADNLEVLANPVERFDWALKISFEIEV